MDICFQLLLEFQLLIPAGGNKHDKEEVMVFNSSFRCKVSWLEKGY